MIRRTSNHGVREPETRESGPRASSARNLRRKTDKGRIQWAQPPYLGVTYYLCKFALQFPRRHNMSDICEAVLLFHVKHDRLLSCESSSGMSQRRLQEQAASIASSSASIANSGWQLVVKGSHAPLHISMCIRPIGPVPLGRWDVFHVKQGTALQCRGSMMSADW